MYGDGVVRVHRVRKWCGGLESGQTDIHDDDDDDDDDCTSCPSISRVDMNAT
jgi:hypothetical protein